MTGIKKITFNGMGIALFVVFTLCLQVPVFQNYYLCLGYVVMAVYSYYFGTFSGTIVGSLGVILYCMLTSGLRGMPGWALGNVVIGLLCEKDKKSGTKVAEGFAYNHNGNHRHCNRNSCSQILHRSHLVRYTVLGSRIHKFFCFCCRYYRSSFGIRALYLW